MKKQDRRQEEPAQWIDGMCDLLKGGAIAGLTALLLLVVCAVSISFGLFGQQWMEGAVLAVCVIGVMTGGCYAVNRIRKHTLVVGLGVACILFLLLLAAGHMAYGSVSIEERGAGILCSCLCGGGIAGILTSRPRKKRKR